MGPELFIIFGWLLASAGAVGVAGRTHNPSLSPARLAAASRTSVPRCVLAGWAVDALPARLATASRQGVPRCVLGGPRMDYPTPKRVAAASRTSVPRCALGGPRMEDAQLAALDVSIIFSYAFARALGSVLLSPDFEGWLSPIHVEPVRFSETIGFACYSTSLWVLGASLSGGFSFVATQNRQAAASMAARSWLAALCLYALATFGLATVLDTCAGLFCSDAALWGQRALFPAPDADTLQAELGLGMALITWRITFADFRDPWR